MFTPISKASIAATTAFLLASCGQNGGQSSADVDPASRVECALAGSSDFERTCSTDRVNGPDGQILTIRHPDGGFRRFKVLTDGRGLAPADGFDATTITLLENGMIEVHSGDDKYRLPAKIKPSEAPAP